MRFDDDVQSSAHKYTNGSSRSPGRKVANGDVHSSPDHSAAYSNGNSAPNRESHPTTFFGHDREEVTRILIQSLTDLGYNKAAGALCKESGYQLEGPTVASFRSAVLEGDWAEAEELLFGTHSYDHGGGIGLDVAGAYGKSWDKSSSRSRPSPGRSNGLTLADDANREEMMFWLKQQKYLELLEKRDLGKALMVLRQELTPLHQDVSRLHTLSSLLMCQTAEDLKSQAQWDGAEGSSRSLLLSELSKSISPSVMIPEHRLSNLLDEVKKSWIENCLYHNSAASPSLYVEHSCDRNDFPRNPYLELRYHKDEVWYLKYSHGGTMLASASKDKTVVVYETTTYKPIWHFKEHEAGVTFLAWSPDDTKLITCGTQQDNTSKIWDIKTGAMLASIHKFEYPCSTAAFTPDGEHVVIGSQDKKGLGVYDLDGGVVYKWSQREELRVHDLAISPDGQRLVVLVESRILVYDLNSYEKLYEWKLAGIKLTSVSISQDSAYMLVSMNENQIKLMEIETGDEVENFTGHTQKSFIIRSSFGGANENFVVSGSEDSRIYIWRTTGANGALVEALDGHTEGCVNAVAWHPRDPRIFASAGDDHKVRIWRPSLASRA